MKPTLIALLALVVAAGCSKKGPPPANSSQPSGLKLNPKPEKEASQPTTPKGINQTSKVAIGTPIWQFKTGFPVESSPAIGSDGTVYVGSGDTKLYAINGQSGVKLWEFETGDSKYGVRSSPAIGSDGTVYVGSNDKKLRTRDWSQARTLRDEFLANLEA